MLQVDFDAQTRDRLERAVDDMRPKFARATERARRSFSDRSRRLDLSPAEHVQLRADAECFAYAVNATELLLDMFFSLGTHEFQYVVKAVEQLAKSVRDIDAALYADLATVNKPPYAECQIYRAQSDYTSFHHMGTGYSIPGGSGSSIDNCRGPLRTDEETSLGMCGSCLKKYGSRLGDSA